MVRAFYFRHINHFTRDYSEWNTTRVSELQLFEWIQLYRTITCLIILVTNHEFPTRAVEYTARSTEFNYHSYSTYSACAFNYCRWQWQRGWNIIINYEINFIWFACGIRFVHLSTVERKKSPKLLRVNFLKLTAILFVTIKMAFFQMIHFSLVAHNRIHSISIYETISLEP